MPRSIGSDLEMWLGKMHCAAWLPFAVVGGHNYGSRALR
jgi:hypothetical protein